MFMPFVMVLLILNVIAQLKNLFHIILISPNHFYYVNDSNPVYNLDQIKMQVINKKGRIWELWNNK